MPEVKSWSGIVGWGAARKILERCQVDDRRELLAGLVVNAGVKGAPAMEYVARLLRWHVDEGDAPIAPLKLTLGEIRFCERRAQELVTPYVEGNDHRLARIKRGLGPSANGKSEEHS